ncbi:hypothetical protein TBR22_A08940 [Luteitalea sp. TBR-22]|uniref:helix-turn-helix domain-containing protein n=1 Tax=Luteitalea sp. TBR-22 TaxID=2802971 RepID=UPI001AF635CE|nr:hypothetical protein [Luteitalea sp. TBR-22]BCS31691.1 hypothetical protein TBR22_A08940 [Luteitalea sp. TBR-22]
MDSLIRAAAHALATGDPLGALKRVALREDAPALALRGLAMAQLGELAKARGLLRRAIRAFGPVDVVSQARCVVADVEIALVLRDMSWSPRTLSAARDTLHTHHDDANAAHARHLEVRRLALIGQLDEAERVATQLDSSELAPTSRAAHELVVAGLALRRLDVTRARAAFGRAALAARTAAIPALSAEVAHASTVLREPAARLIRGSDSRIVTLDDVEALFRSDAVVVDACRCVVRHRQVAVSFRRRPVLLALVRVLAEAWPGDASRERLVARVFGATSADESHRARLRVEVGRLRRLLHGIVGVTATREGFVLTRPSGDDIVVLAPPSDAPHASVLALLADGESWSSSALALALGASQRTVQRALESLQQEGRVHPSGRGRARRWVSLDAPGLATPLLLPGPWPTG